MGRYVLGRLSQAALTLWILSIAIFLSVRLTGDPASYLLGPESSQADYAQLKHNLGLDLPLPVQYGTFLVSVLHGDFGRSYVTGRPARDVLLERLPATVELAAGAFAIIVFLGVPLGVLSAVKRGTAVDVFSKFFAVLGIAAPNFWVATMLIFLLGAVLGWLPTYGQGGLDHLILPAFILAWTGMAGMMRLARSSMLEVLDSEYVKFARVKGLPERLVIYKHALRNAVIPLITFGGLMLAALLNGSVVVEVVFAWPGLGRLMLQGINQRDFTLVQAVVLTAGAFYILSSLLVDILYAYVNPKIRYGT
jgi:peptide/nickel transport system permease protein